MKNRDGGMGEGAVIVLDSLTFSVSRQMAYLNIMGVLI